MYRPFRRILIRAVYTLRHAPVRPFRHARRSACPRVVRIRVQAVRQRPRRIPVHCERPAVRHPSPPAPFHYGKTR